MPPSIEVRDARLVDAGALVAIWRQMSAGAAHQTRLLPTPAEEAVRTAIARHADDPTCRLVVGLCDGEVVAMAYLRRMAISPLHDEATVTVEYLHVMEAARRHGLGKALIAEAAFWAERVNSTHVAVLAPAIGREANRFLARLGLGQAGVLRFAGTHTIRRRLAAEHAPNLLALLSSRRSVLARRAMLHRATDPAVFEEVEVPVTEINFPAAPESAGR